MLFGLSFFFLVSCKKNPRLTTIRNTKKKTGSKKWAMVLGSRSTSSDNSSSYWIIHFSIIGSTSLARTISQKLALTSYSTRDCCYSLRPYQLILVMARMCGKLPASLWYLPLTKISPTDSKHLKLLQNRYWMNSIFVSIQFLKKRDA